MCSPRQLPLVTFGSQSSSWSASLYAVHRRCNTPITGGSGGFGRNSARIGPRSDGSSPAWPNALGRLLPDEGAVLKTADFPDVSTLAATLRRLAAGPEPTEHFRWRARADRAPAFQRVLDMSAHKYTALCRVCERLQADKARS